MVVVAKGAGVAANGIENIARGPSLTASVAGSKPEHNSKNSGQNFQCYGTQIYVFISDFFKYVSLINM